MTRSRDTVEHLSHQIKGLQQFQQLLASEATLTDVTNLLVRVTADYGAESLLEDVIQHLVSEHLALQIEQRRFISHVYSRLPQAESA